MVIWLEEREEEEEKWLKYYSSMHQILLVGEGDFSFSLSLAIAFGSGVNIVATSLDSEGLFFFSLLMFQAWLFCVFACNFGSFCCI